MLSSGNQCAYLCKWDIAELGEVLSGWETDVVESRLLLVEKTRTLDNPRG